MSRSRCGGFAVALALALPPLHWQAHADNYPSRPVTIIVSLAAGTGMDTLVRLYGEKLSSVLASPSSSTTGLAAPASSPARPSPRALPTATRWPWRPAR